MNSGRKEDQAAELRERLYHQVERQVQVNRKRFRSNMDVLNLPPRKEVHANTGRARVKINKLFIRFLFVLLLLTIMIIGAYYYVGEEFYF